MGTGPGNREEPATNMEARRIGTPAGASRTPPWPGSEEGALVRSELNEVRRGQALSVGMGANAFLSGLEVCGVPICLFGTTSTGSPNGFSGFYVSGYTRLT